MRNQKFLGLPLTFGSERVPYSVFDLFGNSTWSGRRRFDANSLFSIHRDPRSGIQCHQGILLSTSDENPWVSMRLHYYLGTSLHPTATATTASAAAASSPATASASAAVIKVEKRNDEINEFRSGVTPTLDIFDLQAILPSSSFSSASAATTSASTSSAPTTVNQLENIFRKKKKEKSER